MLGLRHYHGVAIDLYQGDLATFACDAMVDAAASGSGDAGEAGVSGAGALPASWLIHAAWPVWQGGGHGEATALAAAYRGSLRHAARLGARHVAISAMNHDTYGYPASPAAEQALAAIRGFLDDEPEAARAALKRVTFVLCALEHYHLFQDTLFRLFPEDDR